MLRLTPFNMATIFNRGNQGAGAVPTPTYAQILIDDYGATAVWPLVDIAAGTAIPAYGDAAYNGTLTGWDLQNAAGPVAGSLAPFSDGANDYGNIYSAALASAFDADEGSVFVWVKVPTADVWIDGPVRKIVEIGVDSNNRFLIYSDFSGVVRWRYMAGGVDKASALSEVSSVDWVSFGLSWSTSSDEVKAFFGGAQASTTQTGLGTWVGTVSYAFLGAGSATPTSVWNGHLAYAAVKFGSIWTPANFAAMHAAASTAKAD